MMQTLSVIPVLCSITIDKNSRIFWPQDKVSIVTIWTLKILDYKIAYEINVLWQFQRPKYSCILVIKILYQKQLWYTFLEIAPF